MGKVNFDIGIESVKGVLMGSDPFYIRRYRRKDGTTKSEYWQRGDTSAVIQTKTIETYDASKKRKGENGKRKGENGKEARSKISAKCTLLTRSPKIGRYMK